MPPLTTPLGRAIAAIVSERHAQDLKWGEQNHPDGKWLQILLEELGEYAKATLEGDAVTADSELVQATAVMVAWLEARQRR